jgi:hypothetical protein
MIRAVHWEPAPGGIGRSSRQRNTMALTGLLLLAGCYSYKTAHGPAPDPGSHVSIHLSRDASTTLAPELGPGVVFVEGVVLGDDSAGLRLGVRKIQKAGSVDAEWSGEVVTFPHDSYLSMDEKKLNVPGTVLFGGLAVGAMYVLHSAFNEGSTLNTPPSVVGSPTQ